MSTAQQIPQNLMCVTGFPVSQKLYDRGFRYNSTFWWVSNEEYGSVDLYIGKPTGVLAIPAYTLDDLLRILPYSVTFTRGSYADTVVLVTTPHPLFRTIQRRSNDSDLHALAEIILQLLASKVLDLAPNSLSNRRN